MVYLLFVPSDLSFICRRICLAALIISYRIMVRNCFHRAKQRSILSGVGWHIGIMISGLVDARIFFGKFSFHIGCIIWMKRTFLHRKIFGSEEPGLIV